MSHTSLTFDTRVEMRQPFVLFFVTGHFISDSLKVNKNKQRINFKKSTTPAHANQAKAGAKISVSKLPRMDHEINKNNVAF